MHEQLFRRAAVVQAKLKFLEDQKASFTDREDILAFHRLRKQFDAVVSDHQDELTSDPLGSIKVEFEKDKALINKLRQIDADAGLHLHKLELSTPQSASSTRESIQKIIDWLAWLKESLEGELSGVQSRISHEYWDKDSGELLPDARVIAEALGENDLLARDTKDFVAMASMKGPRYEALLGNIASITELIEKKVFYTARAGERIGPLLLDDLNKLLGERAVFAFDSAWHHAVGKWTPLFELAALLRELDILPVFDKSSPFVEAMLQRKLIYVFHAEKVCGPFLLDNLNLMLADHRVSASDLAWHSVLSGWHPITELIPVLEKQKLFHVIKFVRTKRWLGKNLGAVIVTFLLILFVLGAVLAHHSTTEQSKSPEVSPSPTPLAEAAPSTSLAGEDESWRQLQGDLAEFRSRHKNEAVSENRPDSQRGNTAASPQENDHVSQVAERTLEDAIRAVENRNYSDAALHFDKLAELATDPNVRSKALSVSREMRQLAATNSEADAQQLLRTVRSFHESLKNPSK